MSEATWADWECSDDGTELTYWWQGVPTDDREPGLDSYFTSVHDDVTGQELAYNPGAEDNAWGTPYSVAVTPGHRNVLFVANEAAAFHFETDAYATCHATVAQVPEVVEYDVREVSDVDLLGSLLILIVALWHGITS